MFYINQINRELDDIKYGITDSKDEGKDIKSHFDDSKFRCKKYGKIFCTCDDKFGGFDV